MSTDRQLTLLSVDLPEGWIADFQSNYTGLDATAEAIGAFQTTLATFRAQLFDFDGLVKAAQPIVSSGVGLSNVVASLHLDQSFSWSKWASVDQWLWTPSDHYYYAHSFLYGATHALSLADLDELDRVLSEIDVADEEATFASYVTYLWNLLRDTTVVESRRAWAWRAWRALVFGIRLADVQELLRVGRYAVSRERVSPATASVRRPHTDALNTVILRTGPPRAVPQNIGRRPVTGSEVLAA